jgi:class 3 adenylate cyclase/predicted ATPase
MSDVRQWLDSLDLGQYADAFEENAIEWDQLRDLSNEFLKDVGIQATGHRMRILNAAQQLESESAPKPDTVSAAQIAPVAEPEAERRQLTVMFADLVSSTELFRAFDPEDVRDINRAYQDAAKCAIEKYGGYVARYMGDGVLAYFGYPQAHEDDAERAVRAGLALTESVIGIKAPTSLSARVGVATGPVVVGDLIGEGASQESAVVGETPNLAARLQGLAEPNAVVVSSGTQRLLGEHVTVTELGPEMVKGFPEPIVAFEAKAVATLAGRFDENSFAALTPLAGREEELGLLLRRWQQAIGGEGQVVLLSGEPGVGKSRILGALKEHLTSELRNRVLYYCSPYHTASALYPAIEQIERALRIEILDGPDVRREKLERVVADLGMEANDTVPYLASVLSLLEDDSQSTHQADPQALRRRSLDAIARVLEAMAVQQPVLMVVEDLHWIDPTTLELLGELIERIRTIRVLAVFAYRPEFVPPWGSQPHLTAFTLNNLTERECREIVLRVSGEKKIPEAVVQAILGKTDGVPLFVEELTKTVLDSGHLDDSGIDLDLGELALGIPSSLQDALMARLDRLGPAKELAQFAAAIGRRFSNALLKSVVRLPDSELNDALSRLVEAGLIFRRGLGADTIYEFKHALVQETAYQSLLKRTRERFHGRIAEALEARRETLETQPELLAHHFAQAGRAREAIVYWKIAGERAVGQSANLEAINHLMQGLELLSSLPEDTARIEEELAFLLVLGPALMTTHGWSTPEAETVYMRARELCGQAGASPQQFAATWGMWMLHQARADHQVGRGFAADLLELCQGDAGNDLLLQAHHANWTTLLFTGELDSAWDHVCRGLSIYNPQEHGRHALTYAGHDPGVCGKGQAAVLLWLMGYPDQALDSGKQALVIAKALGHAPSVAHALLFPARVSVMRRDVEATLLQTAEMAVLAKELELAFYLASADLIQGWALTESSDGTGGMPRLNQGLAGLRTIGSKSFGTFNRYLVADACYKQGQPERARQLIDEAFELLEQTGERVWEAELYRLKGELLISEQSSRLAESESLIHKAIEIALARGAKSLELRAATTLARLWSDQGKNREARALLAPVYNWFTEGFDTPDLIDAKSLLDTLC